MYSVHCEVVCTKSFNSELTSSGHALCQQSIEDKDNEHLDHGHSIMLSGLYDCRVITSPFDCRLIINFVSCNYKHSITVPLWQGDLNQLLL